MEILTINNNYIDFLVNDRKLLSRKNQYNEDYQNDAHASAFELAFNIIKHNIDSLRVGNKNLYILCDHRYNLKADIESDISDALKIMYKCPSRSTFLDFDISNIVSIRSEFKKSRDVYGESFSFDDFMFWVLGISISSFIHGCFENNPENFVTYLRPDGNQNLNDIIELFKF
jgi:hypothetical protein